MRYAVVFWQHAKLVTANVFARNGDLAYDIVARTFAGAEIIRVHKAPTAIRSAICRSAYD